MRLFILFLLLFLAACGSEQRDLRPLAAPPPVMSAMKAPTATDRVMDSVVNQLSKTASLAFSIPESANIDDRIDAELIVDIGREVEQVVKDLKVKGQTVTAKIKTTNIIKARLVAPDFTVVNIEDEEQAIDVGAPAIWHWTLIPKSAGTYDVYLTVDAKVEINGKEKTSHIKTFEKVVKIDITTKQSITRWVVSRWESLASYLWGALFIPLIGWWWKKKFRRSK